MYSSCSYSLFFKFVMAHCDGKDQILAELVVPTFLCQILNFKISTPHDIIPDKCIFSVIRYCCQRCFISSISGNYQMEYRMCCSRTRNPTLFLHLDISLEKTLNSVHRSLRNEAFLPNFSPPDVFSGEHIGVEYLRTQSDSQAEKELDKEIDEVFEHYESSETDLVEDTEVQDLTLALPEDSSDNDSGTEVGFKSPKNKKEDKNKQKSETDETLNGLNMFFFFGMTAALLRTL